MSRNKRVILVEPDPFIGRARTVAGYVPDYNRAYATDDGERHLYEMSRSVAAAKAQVELDDIEVVSRPVQGISIKPNTHAYVQVVASNGEVLKVFNRIGVRTASDGSASGNLSPPTITNRIDAIVDKMAASARELLGVETAMEGGDGKTIDGHADPNSAAWTDWILTSVSEQRSEKTQLIETFGDNYLYSFGEKPRALQFTGMLFNTEDFNWRSQFWENWSRFFRASKLVELGARVYIGFDNIIVGGYPLNAQAQQTADTNNAMSFGFTFYVTSYLDLAAQSGFRAGANQMIPSIKSGFETGEARLKPTRSSLIEMLNFYNDGTQFTGVDKDGNPNEASAQDVALAKMLARAANGAFAIGAGEANAMSWIRAFMLRTAQDQLRLHVNAKIQELEDTGLYGITDRLKRGEINAWFGYLSAVLRLLDTSEWDGLAGKLTQLGGLSDFLLAGSVSRLVDHMAYTGVGLATQFLPAPRAGGVTVTSVAPYSNAGALGTR